MPAMGPILPFAVRPRRWWLTLPVAAGSACCSGSQGQALINRLCVQAAIEQYYGVSLATTPPEVLQTVVQQSRAAGNAAYKKRQYAGTRKL